MNNMLYSVFHTSGRENLEDRRDIENIFSRILTGQDRIPYISLYLLCC